jgi:hypothetical protein
MSCAQEISRSEFFRDDAIQAGPCRGVNTCCKKTFMLKFLAIYAGTGVGGAKEKATRNGVAST